MLLIGLGGGKPLQTPALGASIIAPSALKVDESLNILLKSAPIDEFSRVHHEQHRFYTIGLWLIQCEPYDMTLNYSHD